MGFGAGGSTEINGGSVATTGDQTYNDDVALGGSTTFSGTLAIGDADAGEMLTATLGNPGAVLTAGGVPVTWAGVGTGTLIGSVGGSEVIRVTLASNGAYTVTLSRAVDHPTVKAIPLRAPCPAVVQCCLPSSNTPI